MSFEYILDYDCPAKENLSTQELFLLRKQKNQIESITNMVRESGDTRPLSEITVTQQLQTPEGISNVEINLQELIDQTKSIEKFQDICSKCNANIHKNTVGCYGAIQYPIKKQTEEWLMSLLPDDLSSLAGVYIQKSIKDFNYDGKVIQEMRRSGILFESKKSQTIKWGNIFSGWKINSNQLLQMMFCMGPMQSFHCVMLSLFLGTLPHDLKEEQLLQENSTLLAKHIDKDRINTKHEGQIKDFTNYLRALIVAGVLDCTLMTDY